MIHLRPVGTTASRFVRFGWVLRSCDSLLLDGYWRPVVHFPPVGSIISRLTFLSRVLPSSGALISYGFFPMVTRFFLTGTRRKRLVCLSGFFLPMTHSHPVGSGSERFTILFRVLVYDGSLTPSGFSNLLVR